jgi:hypothetical protein
MTTTNTETQIQLQETQLAYQAFLDVCHALSPIATDANDYPQQIANTAMQSTAGTAFANCVSDWTANFNQLWTVLQQITAQIEAQHTAMANVESTNTGLATGTLNPGVAPDDIQQAATPPTPTSTGALNPGVAPDDMRLAELPPTPTSA